uniref:Actin-like protein 6A n=1 Tax=Plectus sambesii TaxID=2011161 RepID=A0A914UP98_9BILA
MSGGVYGGDEVGALVFDVGHHSFRVGYAGEEFPKADVPSHVGVVEKIIAENGDSMEVDENKRNSSEAQKKIKKYSFGTANISAPRPDMEIETFLKDGMVEDWDMFEAMLDHMYANCLFSESKYHPVLFSEPAWNTKTKREKLIEVMFEKYNAPAFFVCKNAVLAAFANGRSSGLVLDSGSTYTSAVPVYDGYCLTQAIVKSPLGGNMVSEQCKLMLQEQGIEVVPTYKIA